MESVADLRDINGRGDRDLVRELEVNKASLNMKSFFDLELEVQELAGESHADDAAEVGLNWPLRGLEAGCSLAVAPPGIGRQSLHTMKTRVTTCWNIRCIAVPFITADILTPTAGLMPSNQCLCVCGR